MDHIFSQALDIPGCSVPFLSHNSSSLFLSSLKNSAVMALSNLAGLQNHYYLIFCLLILAIWTALVLYSTFLASNANSSLNMLSLWASTQELLDMRKRGSRLDVLDVFRVVAICWCAELFKKAVHDHPIFGALLGNSALGVEIFLVLSGLLAAKSWNSKAEINFDKHCFSFLVKRCLRLIPIVAVFVFLATGPLVQSVLPKFHSTMVSSCTPRTLLSHLTLTSNWQETPTCLGYLWYLGLDMQLYLIAPFLLHLLHRRPRLAIATFAFLICISAFLRALYCQIYGVCNSSDVDIPFISFPDQSPENTSLIYDGLWQMYSRPHTKCAPFLIGLLLGYWMDKEEMHVKLSFLNTRFVFLTALLGGIAVIYGILPEYWYPNQGNTLYNTLYTALFRTVFAACIATMIAALFLSTRRTEVNRYWAIAAKLTFNVYLLHMPVVYLFNHVQAFQEATSVLGLLIALPFASLHWEDCLAHCFRKPCCDQLNNEHFLV
uniref:Acyltransferase 3 domain-containing protein n=1 Tax=Ditylenchus dipsaci TaxID=166011 RepID=A0A915CMP9_9BILA